MAIELADGSCARAADAMASVTVTASEASAMRNGVETVIMKLLWLGRS